MQFYKDQQSFLPALILILVGGISLAVTLIEPFAGIIDSYNLYLILRSLTVAEEIPPVTQFYSSDLRELNIIIILLGLAHIVFSFYSRNQIQTWKNKPSTEIIEHLKTQGQNRVTPKTHK
jgi:hypothetical protein